MSSFDNQNIDVGSTFDDVFREALKRNRDRLRADAMALQERMSKEIPGYDRKIFEALDHMPAETIDDMGHEAKMLNTTIKLATEKLETAEKHKEEEKAK